eukprot:CAMPEP_0114249566 /NCGR_PEP_ID=MMETSP0058-20121206/14213_1 /TAXON_ID=36894 /ORGANISM="Pyramimonas parkeae, CCMP726" /LENGTH=109 /DNA_ID=CAMNT_0001363125 /DNA_START=62 /DNA_END=391 /DNA_ORIENTATION=+
MASAFLPIMVLFVPGAAIVFASISLFQFTQLFKAFVAVSQKSRGNAVWKFFQPHLKQMGAVLQSVLGPADKFNVNLTHVVLVALMITIIVCAERLRSVIADNKRISGRS